MAPSKVLPSAPSLSLQQTTSATASAIDHRPHSPLVLRPSRRIEKQIYHSASLFLSP